jgi:hypothetical protein
MRRRDIPTVLFATAATGTMASSQTTAQTYAAHAQTVAEASAKVSPRKTEYPEGDLRRYGASIAASDNSDAINSALLVSAHGGNPAFIPGGTWKIGTPIQATMNGSMCGVGNASIIAPQACDGIIFGNSGNYAITGLSRFFRDFQIVGSNAADSTHKGIIVDFTAPSTERVNAVQFENLFIANFGTGAYLRGLWFSNFVGCHFYNCYHGIYFIGQNCANSIVNCTLNRGDIRGSGGAWGVSFQTIDKETTQSTRIISGHIFFYDILINAVLAFELQIEHCDLSAAQSIGVQIITTIGGCRLRDCWIETDNSSATTGVKVASILPSTYTSVHIIGNHITCDIPCAGSRGISIGHNNAGMVVNENAIINFDQAITLGASANLVCKFNRINCVTPVYSASSHAIFLDSLAADNEIGPNEIIAGAAQPAIMSADAPHISVPASSSPAVGTPIQFDASVNGFTSGVSYFVLSSASNVITVGSVVKGPAISATGAKPVNVRAAPLPLIFTRGTPRGLSFYGSGSFVLTLAGFNQLLTGAVNWVSSGKFVALTIADATPLTGPSHSTEMTGSGVPGFLWPATLQLFPASVQDSGAFTCGVARLTPTGALTFFKTPNLEGFTPSGSKGVNIMALTYVYT